MIPRAQITAWRATAPWSDDAQVEQDLVLSRALVEIFSVRALASSLALRGGTAYHKVFLGKPARYSEDIDLVQRAEGPIGPILDALREKLDPWLGKARHKKGEGGTTLTYKFDSEIAPVRPLRVKLEINTREQFTVFGHEEKRYAVASPWFTGAAEVVTYALDELLATKLRALYQRKAGPLRPLARAHDRQRGPEARREGLRPLPRARGHEDHATRVRAESRREIGDKAFLGDLPPLLATGAGYDPAEAHRVVLAELVDRL